MIQDANRVEIRHLLTEPEFSPDELMQNRIQALRSWAFMDIPPRELAAMLDFGRQPAKRLIRA